MTLTTETTFKVGDKVRVTSSWYPINFPQGTTGKVTALLDSGYISVRPDNPPVSPTDGLNPGWSFRADHLEKIEPKFKAGDIVQMRGSKATGYKVLGPASASGLGAGLEYRVENLTYGNRLDVRESEIWAAPSQVLKLKPGDKVKNLKTGRTGVVVVGSHPDAGPRFPTEPYVIDAPYDGDPIVRDRVPARALEAWEAEHPGTYDIIVDTPPW